MLVALVTMKNKLINITAVIACFILAMNGGYTSANPSKYGSVAHVSSHSSLSSAKQFYREIIEQLPHLSNRIKPFIHKVDLKSKGEWYRLQLSPVDPRLSIEQLCQELQPIKIEFCNITTSMEVSGQIQGFSGDLVLTPTGDGTNMKVLKPIKFVDNNGRVWVVPQGNRTDGASIPRSLWSLVGSPFTGKYLKASVIHDYYVRTKFRSWMSTHNVFFEAMISNGVERKKALIMWAAVYRFGPRWSRNQSMCWDICACSDAFIEHLTVQPEFSNFEFQKLKSLLLKHPNSTISEISKKIDKSFEEQRGGDSYPRASITGFIHFDDCEDEPHKRNRVVNAKAPENWDAIGRISYRYIPDPVYQVVNVRKYDVLNVRSQPTSYANIVGRLSPNASGIKMIGACNETWCKVNQGRITGWVNGKFLGIDYELSKIYPADELDMSRR